MDELCRLCGSEDGIKVSIFEPDKERAKKIHKILPITVNEHDLFSKSICHKCSFKVNEFFEFRTTCIKTQEFFKQQVPWLRDKQRRCVNEGQQPMVEVTLNSVNVVSASEKQIDPYNGSNENMIVIDDDSPPYNNNPVPTNDYSSECDPEERNFNVKKPKKSKSKSIWESKKKRKRRKSYRITEVFTTSIDEYQNIGDIENDPLLVSTDNNCENNSCTVESPKNECSNVKKEIFTDDKVGENIALPKHILTTNIPRVGNVYTCEKCGRTFLNPHPASLHSCSVEPVAESERSKEKVENVEDKDKAKDFYDCTECGQVFSRHSQLITHKKKHINCESSDDDDFKPFNSRKKHSSRKKPKQRLLNLNNFDSSKFFEDLTKGETGITRHSLLSSDSD